MGDKVKTTAKTSEPKQENSDFKKRKPDFYQDLHSPFENIFFLQRAAGNQAVQRLFRSGAIRPKLKISQPGDKYEQEADRIADQVMQMPEPKAAQRPEEDLVPTQPLARSIRPFSQAQTEEEVEEKVQRDPVSEQRAAIVQPKKDDEEEEDEILHRKEALGRVPEVTPDLEGRIRASRGRGQPLSESVRSFFQPRFGLDFRGVRVHRDTQAAESAQKANARAFTIGQDVVFGAGQYAPETSEGRRLLAHELTHTVQQSGGLLNTQSIARAKLATAEAPHTVPGENPAVEGSAKVKKKAEPSSAVSESLPEGGVSREPAPEREPIRKRAPEAPPSKSPKSVPEKKRTAALGEGPKKEREERVAGPEEGTAKEAGEKEAAPAETEAVSMTPEGPGQVLEQLKNVQPTSAIEAYDRAQKASSVELSKQKQKVEQGLPAIPAPTGLPAKGSGRKEKGEAPSDGEKAPAAFEGEKSGREGEEYETKAEEAPPPPPATPTTLRGGEDKESGEGDAELSRSAQNSLESVQLDTGEIRTSAGERPAVDMTGEADPSQMDSFESESSTKVRMAKAKASQEIYRDFGENDIFPEPTHEILKARKALASPKSPSGKGGAALSVPAEAVGGLNRSLGPILRERLGGQKERYDSGEEKFESDSADARADADKQIADLKNETRQKQTEEQVNTKAEVAQSRAEWQTDLDGVEQDYQKKAGKATQEQKDKIVKEKQKGEGEAAKHLEEAEKKAKGKKEEAEKEARNKKQEAKKESKGFWGWVKSKASALINGLKKAINFIYDNLRKAVKLIFEAAKKLVKAAIELARRAIVGLIKGLGIILKGFVTIVFAAFPNIRRKINSKIDKAVNTAVKGVNKAAEYLKKGVDAVLNFLASTLDKLLGLVQSLYNGIFNVIGMIIRGEFKELMERIGSLVDAAKEMPSHLEGAVWEQLIGVDISKPMPGEAGYEPAEGAPKEPEERGSAEESSLTEDDISAEPVPADSFDPELLEDLDLQEGEEKVLGERSGEAYSLAGILADFPQAESGVSPAVSRETAAKSETGSRHTPTPAMGRAERAGKVWDQIKTFMGNWLKANWGKLLLAVIGALVGLIAATILTGGAILAALPIIMKIVAAIFVGVAIMKAMEYLRTYLSEGWEKRILAAAKGLAGAIAVGIVELAMALGFRVIGAGLKAAGKVVKAGVKVVVTGVKRAATATIAAIKGLLKSGATLVSRSGSAIIRGGKLVLKGLERGFSKGIKKTKDLASRLFAKFRFRKFKIVRKGKRIQLFGYINPWVLFYDGELMEVRGERGGGRLKPHERVEVEIPGRRARTGIVLKNKEMAEQLSKLSDAQRRTAYNNLRDFRRLHPTQELELHHIATNKNYLWGEKWSRTFEDLFKKGGMSLDDEVNKVLLPRHAGPHPDAYHEWVHRRLLMAVKGVAGKESIGNVLKNELKAIAMDLRSNPRLLWP